MRHLKFGLVGVAFLGVAAVAASAGEVIINELMYHPASEDDREEFVELHNTGTNAVDLAGWRFSTGVRSTFGQVSLPPGGYLVVAADVVTFRNKYPDVTAVVGGWDGILSNSGQLLELMNPQGQREDAVRYADEGDWAVREKAPIDYGHRGWRWVSLADGGGRSLELVNPRLPNQHGQNWAPSAEPGGTPGRANSVLSLDAAPLILEAAHFPLVPKSTDLTTITARILDEQASGLTARLHWRSEGAADFNAVLMTDDGLHGDGAPGDGVYGATLGPQPNNTIIEFYFSASDATGHTRTWPAPAMIDGEATQSVNALLQIDDNDFTGPQPLYKFILKEADLAELRQINANTPKAPFDTTDQTRSHAQLNATFISFDGTSAELRYLVAVRNRGNGSRTARPQSYRVNFRNDEPWKDVSALNLNTQQTHAQLFGSVLYNRAGLPTQLARAVQVRVNNVNYATAGPPNYGVYVCNEVLNSEFAARAFPRDSSGNLYRGIRLAGKGADLHFEGDAPDPYRTNYFKHTNTSQDDWSDLIELTRVLDTTPDTDYLAAVRRVVNVEAWMRYFALEALVDNRETNLANGSNGTGQGDDYFLYRGVADRRFQVLPYDLDSILGQGTSSANVRDGLFRMLVVKVLDRFMRQPEFARTYYRTLKELCDTTFADEPMARLLDRTLSGLVPASVIDAMKTFASERRLFVLSEIPQTITISNSLPVVNGYPRTTNPSVPLDGRASVLDTYSVLVNGQSAAWSVFDGKWSRTDVALRPGLNRVLVQALDQSGLELERATVDIWLDSGAPTPRSGPLAGNATWTTAAGPYLVSSTVTVPAGATLTIEPGTTVYFAAGAGLTVTGRLLAEGTDLARIMFARQPGSAGAWAGITLNNTGTSASRIAYAHFDGAGSAGHNVRAENSTLFLEHCTFANTTVQYVDLVNSSFRIADCVFPATQGIELIHGSGLPASGFGILQGNFFGGTSGYNDIIDFTGGNRPNAIVQFLDNVFASATDDCFDMDGTDAHIEGNLFLNVRQDAPRSSTSNAVTTGADGANTSELTVVRNIFYNLDHALLLKDAGSAVFHHNTVVHITDNPNDTAPGALLTFYEDRSGVSSGKLADLDGNIIWDVTAARLANAFTNPPAQFLVNRSILPGPLPAGASGGGNVIEDPRFVGYPGTLTVENIRAALALRPGSPALGTGPNGLDMGALVPAGASISGVPRSPTFHTSATLTIGGPGITHYQWKLDDGAWSAERPVSEPLALSGLANGTHTIAVLGKNSAGSWQAEAQATTRSWTVDSSHARLLLNEVLARNVSAAPHGETFPDLIELFNDSAAPFDLSGLGLTDEQTTPYKFTFPKGTVIPAEGYLVLYANNPDGTPGLHLGFGLNQNGDALFLNDKLANGGKLLDSIAFGLQLADLSIGRLADGRWALCQPTFGAANVPQRAGDPATLRLNEWLADGKALFRDDFVELFNPDALPVALGGLYLTDAPTGWPAKHAIAPLSFIGGGGFTLFTADGQTDKGAEHLNFALAPEQGMIALFAADGSLIDSVYYGPQRTDVSEGRSPNGAEKVSAFAQPTPGGGNPGSATSTEITTVTLDLLSITNEWKYYQSGDPGASWRDTTFNDTSWPVGRALLQVENDALPAPKNTTLAIGKTTYYFRTRFVFPTNAAGWKLEARTVIDDGAVLYLNGSELARLGMAAGTVNYDTHANRTVGNARFEGPFELPATNLREGENLLAVEVHQSSSDSADITFGLKLDATMTVTNVHANVIPVVLNEVLAHHLTLANRAGSLRDWVELYHPADNVADLSGLSLSDDVSNPRKWVFPAGATIGPRSYLVIECDSSRPASAINTGFALNAQGGGVYCYDSPARGAGLLDSILYGLQTADFSIGRVPDGSETWKLNLPTPAAANLAAATGTPLALRINEWMADPASGDDWFEIYNPNAQPVELSGLYLTDDLNKRQQFAIRPLSFIGTGANAYLVFEAGGAPGNGADLTNFKLSPAGESLGLFNAYGLQIDSVTFGAQTRGVSEGRLPDGAAGITSFANTASPGASNFKALAEVVINEVLTHTDPPLEDAIELHNPTATDVAIGGWYLSNSAYELKRFRVPAGTKLPARGYLVFYETQFNGGEGSLVPFTLNSAHGDQVFLSAAEANGELTGFRAHAKFGAAENGVSLGRYATSVGADFVALSQRTLGADNPATVEQFRLGKGLANAGPKIGPLVINELLYRPVTSSGAVSVEAPEEEFIELLNVSGAPVSLHDPLHDTNRWAFRDGVEFVFPTGLSVPSGGFLLLVGFDPVANPAALEAFRARHTVPEGLPVLGPFAGRLNNDGERVELYRPDAPQPPPHPDAGFVPFVLVDSVRYGVTSPWPTEPTTNGFSLQRRKAAEYGNEPLNWFAAAPTPGRANRDAPADADRDRDGMSDAWEQANHFSADDPNDATLDADGDGLTNLQEFTAGTNPRDKASTLAMEAAWAANGQFVLRFLAVAGKTYTVQYRDSLGGGEWLRLANLGPAANTSLLSLGDPAAFQSATRYYRVVTPALP
jgi:hypothetical protein